LKQKKIIDYQHHRIQDSIKAALRIQQIILPAPEQCKNILLDYFIIYQPKDIVSGDFYFIEERAGKAFIACVDCTGHGVSGAFMTLITHQVLHNLIFERCLDSPIDILKGLENMIRKTLRQEENRLEMGMDIALLVIEERTSEGARVCFGGAKSDLYFLTPKEESIQTICATKKSIGTDFCREKTFRQESLILPTGTLVYMCSDGFGHQNDVHEKKFGKKRLFELIERNRKYSLATQHEIIKHAFEEHKGNQVQRDDVLLMGFRI
jgi:serine phosphatase RsbU (regulator of sigma subunit)